MKQLFGFISTLAASILLIHIGGEVLGDVKRLSDAGTFLTLVTFLIGLPATIVYNLLTRFWTSTSNALTTLEVETEIIKKQIEKAELLAKLRKLEDTVD